jgi:hypothetical protein
MEPLDEVGVARTFEPAQPRRGTARPAATRKIFRGADTVELALVRRDLVDRVRSQIESGHYETEGRLAGAAGAMLRAFEAR